MSRCDHNYQHRWLIYFGYWCWITPFWYRCCEETFQIQIEKQKVNQTESNQTNILTHESLICPRTNSSSLTTLKLKDEEPKICEFGAFQDYRMKIATTEMVFLDQEKKHVLVNRTWLELPNLQIPVHSDTYCVRWNYIFSYNRKPIF